MTNPLSDPGPAPAADRLLPWPTVRALTGISRSTAWRLQKSGDFPAPVMISPGRVGWRESELEAWKASRAPRRAARPAASGPPRPSGAASVDASYAGRPAQPDVPRSPEASGSATPASPKPPLRPRPAGTAPVSHHRRRRPPHDSRQIAFDFG